MLLRFVNPLRAEHEVPKYTESRSPCNPEVHEVSCASAFPPYSLKMMKGPSLKTAVLQSTKNQAEDSLLRVPLWPSVVNQLETYGMNKSVSNPLAPNSSEINQTYGITERGPFFVKLSRFAGVREASPQAKSRAKSRDLFTTEDKVRIKPNPFSIRSHLTPMKSTRRTEERNEAPFL
jgi:hypothetical protein